MNTENEHFYQIGLDMENELRSSMDKYPLFNSAHEGYAVILEELDELWDEIKKKQPDEKRLREEAIQVGAMAMKFILSMENDWESNFRILDEEKLLGFEAKCQQCRYTVMSKEDIERLGHDPCDTCIDLSNWKSKGVEG